MLLVGVVALDLALARVLLENDVETLCGSVLIVLSLEVGMVRLYRGPARARAFWAGFVTAGFLVFATFLRADWAEMSGTFWYRIWRDYAGLAAQCLDQIPGGRTLLYGNLKRGELPIVVSATFVLSLPQLVIALASGYAARFVYAHTTKWRPANTSPAPEPLPIPRPTAQ